MKHIFAVALLAVAPGITWANIIPTGTTITGAGPFTWSYSLELSQDQNVNSGPAPTTAVVPHTNLDVGGFITIYNFAGYIAGSCVGPAGWTCSARKVGFTPDDVAPIDNAAIENITWVYTSGPTLLGQPDGQNLGLFSANSIYSQAHLVSYAARGIKNNGASIGTIADNVGNTRGPVGLPEPASLALAGLGLMLMAGRLRTQHNT